MTVTVSLADLLPNLMPDTLVEIYLQLRTKAQVLKTPDDKLDVLIVIVRMQAEAVLGKDHFAQAVGEPAAAGK